MEFIVINQILQSPGIYYRSELDHNGISVLINRIGFHSSKVSPRLENTILGTGRGPFLEKTTIAMKKRRLYQSLYV